MTFANTSSAHPCAVIEVYQRVTWDLEPTRCSTVVSLFSLKEISIRTPHLHISLFPSMALFPFLKSAGCITNHLKHRPIPVVHRSLHTQQLTARSPTFPDDVQQFDFLSSGIIPKIRDHTALTADDSIPVCHKKVWHCLIQSTWKSKHKSRENSY